MNRNCHKSNYFHCKYSKLSMGGDSQPTNYVVFLCSQPRRTPHKKNKTNAWACKRLTRRRRAHFPLCNDCNHIPLVTVIERWLDREICNLPCLDSDCTVGSDRFICRGNERMHSRKHSSDRPSGHDGTVARELVLPYAPVR